MTSAELQAEAQRLGNLQPLVELREAAEKLRDVCVPIVNVCATCELWLELPPNRHYQKEPGESSAEWLARADAVRASDEQLLAVAIGDGAGLGARIDALLLAIERVKGPK